MQLIKRLNEYKHMLCIISIWNEISAVNLLSADSKVEDEVKQLMDTTLDVAGVKPVTLFTSLREKQLNRQIFSKWIYFYIFHYQ